MHPLSPATRRAATLAGLTVALAAPATIALAADGPDADAGGAALLSPAGLSAPLSTADVVSDHLRAHRAYLRHRTALRATLRTARKLADARDEELSQRWVVRVAGRGVHSLRVKNRQLRRDLRELREKQATGGAPDVAIPGALASIAACESGGNPAAIGGGGAYRGKYQFDYGTWASVGGSGDPAAAPEAEQDRRAAMLYAKAGATPWPVCGR